MEDNISRTLLVFISMSLAFTAINATIPSEVGVSLVNDAVDEYIELGEKIKMTMAISFPAGSTSDCIVELLSSLEEINMALTGEYTVTTGSKISSVSSTTATFHLGDTYLDSTLGITYDTRAVIPLGTVIHDGTDDADDAQHQVKVEFYVVYMNPGTLATDAPIIVSTGIEYSGGSLVWIAQNTFNAIIVSPTVSASPILTVTDNPAEIELGLMTEFTLETKIPNAYTDLTVEAMIINDTTSSIGIAKMYVEDGTVGSSYGYSLVPVNLVKEGYGSCPMSNHLILPIGTIVNKESQTGTWSSADDVINVKIQVQTIYDESLIDEERCIGVGVVMDQSEIWVAEFCALIKARTTSENAFSTVNLSPKDSDNVPIAQPAFLYVDIELPEMVGGNFTVDVTSSAVTGGSTNALHLLSIASVSRGGNIPCEPTYITSFTEDSSLKINTAGQMNMLAQNIGLNGSSASGINTLTLLVTALLMPSATETHQYRLGVTVTKVADTGQTWTGGQVFTAAAFQDYPSTVNFDFNLTSCNLPSSTAAKMYVNSTMTFDLTVKTEPDVVSGPMTLEVPIPVNMTSSNLQFCEATVTSVGRNVVCLQPGTLTANLSSWANDGILDRAVINFDLLCNVQIYPSDEDNEFVISINVMAKDTAELRSGNVNDYFGLGLKFSKTQIWVAQTSVELIGATCFGGVKFLEGFKIKVADLGTDTWPHIFQLRHSPDGEYFYDVNISAASAVGSVDGSGFQEYLLEKPVLAMCAALDAQDCVATCYVESDFVIADPSGIIDVLNDADSSILKSLHWAFDDEKDNTCLDLPGTQKLFFLRLNTTFKTLSLNQNQFRFTIKGKGLTCERHISSSVKKIVQTFIKVSNPYVSSMDNFEGELKFCTVLSDTTDGTLRTCEYECACTDAITCSEIMMYMLKMEEDGQDWQLCDISAVNY